MSSTWPAARAVGSTAPRKSSSWTAKSTWSGASGAAEASPDLFTFARHERAQGDGRPSERADQRAQHGVELDSLIRILRQFPGLGLIDERIGASNHRHRGLDTVVEKQSVHGRSPGIDRLVAGDVEVGFLTARDRAVPILDDHRNRPVQKVAEIVGEVRLVPCVELVQERLDRYGPLGTIDVLRIGMQGRVTGGQTPHDSGGGIVDRHQQKAEAEHRGREQ